MTAKGTPIEAFIFDMDGVLLHTMPLHTLAWERYLETLGIEVTDLERRMHGRRNEELVRDFLGAETSDELAFGHGASKERLFRKLASAADREQLEIKGVRQFLIRYRNVPKAIGSNAERANIDFALDQFGLREFFTIAVDGLQVERPKPYPDIYLKAAEMLGVPAAGCVVFEDSPAGAQAGLMAGMQVIGIESTPTEFPEVSLRVGDFCDPGLEAWLAARMKTKDLEVKT